MRSIQSEAPRLHARMWLIMGAACLLLVLGAGTAVVLSLWHSSYAAVDNRFFSSDFVTGRNVLVLIPHEDDEINLAYGVIDAFTAAGSDVTIAYSTNGDARFPAETRVREALTAAALMGVPEENVVLLGYGDHMTDPALYRDEMNRQRVSEAGHSETYGVAGIEDYHSLCYGTSAAYTRAHFEADIWTLIVRLRPDVIFVTDTDDHIDHVSLSQTFDRVLGRVLREDMSYRPTVFKGFCYEYAWHGNEDFYRIPLLSGEEAWKSTSYQNAYAWSERVRFPLPGEYLGYTLRSSKLRQLLLCHASQNAVIKQENLQNGDRVYWERRTDVLLADVSASSGDAALLQDFIISGTREAPLEVCWIPAEEDARPELRFTWDEPQAIAEVVFYDAATPGGDVKTVELSDDRGDTLRYALDDAEGGPSRCKIAFAPTRTLTIRVLERDGVSAGLYEVEILPEREQTPLWLQPMDENGTFLYEYAPPANEAFTLQLYGYPQAPAEVEAIIVREKGAETVANAKYDGQRLWIPALEAGRYRLRIRSGACGTELVLRVGDGMLWERAQQLSERKLGAVLPQ